MCVLGVWNSGCNNDWWITLPLAGHFHSVCLSQAGLTQTHTHVWFHVQFISHKDKHKDIKSVCDSASHCALNNCTHAHTLTALAFVFPNWPLEKNGFIQVVVLVYIPDTETVISLLSCCLSVCGSICVADVGSKQIPWLWTILVPFPNKLFYTIQYCVFFQI